MGDKPREWWIGRTRNGFDKWLAAKHPEQTECDNTFICSDGQDECAEYIRVIEYSAYEELKKRVDYLEERYLHAEMENIKHDL